jgi:uncharacterized protein
MSSSSSGAHRRVTISRLSFPDDEARQRWLPLLLKVHATVDTGVAEAIAAAEAGGRRLACARGCGACCRSHTTIPVYPLELVGLTWYVVEKVGPPLRERLRAQLAAHVTGAPCPMLVDDACAVHAVRPMACRQFNVFGSACAEGEDAYYTRREDVLTPIKAYTNAAFNTMLLFHDVSDDGQRSEMVARGAMHSLVRVLQEYDWPRLAARMRDFDSASAARAAAGGA